MRNSFLYKGVLVATGLCVVPAALAASPKGGDPGGRTAAVTPGTSPKETSALLEQMRIDAMSVENDAGQLEMLVREGYFNTKQDDAPLLDNVRDEVNQMNKLLSSLRVHEAEASPVQHEIIKRVAAPAIEMAGTTELAIDTLNNDAAHLYMSDLPGLANAIYQEASRVDQTVGELDKFVHARHEEQQLRQTLGLKGNS
jgi:hypothetical protein